MVLKFNRVIGIVGTIIAVLVSLFFIKECIYALTQPFVCIEAKGYAYYIIYIISAYIMASLSGLAGSIIVLRKTMLSIILLLISGVLMIFFIICLNMYVCPLWPFMIPPILHLFAGLFVLIDKKTKLD